MATATSQTVFDTYLSHYGRLNKHPNWKAAEAKPQQHACQKPWLPKDKSARILDFGCGWGAQLLSLWCAGYANLEGVDMVSEQVAIANQCAEGRVPIVCKNGREYLDGTSNVYDLIILNDVLEHIPPTETLPLLGQLYDALVPGGCLVVRVPNMAILIGAFSHAVDWTHVSGYTEQSLVQVLERSGFTDHQFVSDSPRCDWRRWRPWAPWRGFGIRNRVNSSLHRVVYWLSGKPTKPTIFSYNLEIYSRKPQ